MAGDMTAEQAELLQELQARALAQAAQATGLSASAVMAALPLLPNMAGMGQQEARTAGVMTVAATSELELEDLDDVEEGADDGQSDLSFTCSVCRKVFKREMNLIFHMTTHRPRQPPAESTEPTSTQPVKCQDCNKEFATKYQAKKHYLRRHFQGDKPFRCNKCNKKSFVVKEDLTMHMKSCGNVYVCNCGIRLCSLGALKRHCKYFTHEPESLEPKPEEAVGAAGSLIEWNSVPAFRAQQGHADGSDEGAAPSADGSYHQLGSAERQQQQQLPAATPRQQQRLAGMQQLAGGGGGSMGGEDPMHVCSHAAIMRQMATQAGGGPDDSWTAAGQRGADASGLFPGMPLSLVHALRQAQADHSYGRMAEQSNGVGYGQMPMQRLGYPGGAQMQQHHPSASAALNAAVSAAYAQSNSGGGYPAGVDLGAYQHEQH